MGRGVTLGNMSEPVVKPITQRWWWPTAVVVFVLLALVGADRLGFLQDGQDALCGLRDFFIGMTGETPDTCP